MSIDQKTCPSQEKYRYEEKFSGFGWACLLPHRTEWRSLTAFPIWLIGNAFGPSYPPSQRTIHRFARHGSKCLFVKGHSTRGINPDKNLGGSGS